jgi:hypothetical protein
MERELPGRQRFSIDSGMEIDRSALQKLAEAQSLKAYKKALSIVIQECTSGVKTTEYYFTLS